MKFSAILTSIAALPFVAHAITVSFDQVYDNAAGSLTTVACSDGSNGLINRGFNKFSDLPSFPNIGGAPAITGFNSAACGTCWELTFTNAQGAKKSVNVTAIDVASPTSFNIALTSMNTLTNGQAVALGRVNVTTRQVPASGCGL
ncbi:immunomodulatory protein [Crucibulum laeve]|uniref:Immunomodulatory protein n=1 Tax=Crucibulum laeve TaxID=68775 RepID=A0A5C3LS49_9AGAR|nr:immunomodulatory protein [Crucibulum laeve]